TTTPGDKPGTVVVTYPDGTKDEVPVTVKVKPQSDEFTPVGKDVPAKHGDTPNAADGISNKADLPAGTTYDWKTPVDTSTPGDKPGTVVVTYPDGTKDEVPVTVKVQPQTDDYDPQAKPVAVDHGATPNAEDGIANKGDLPAGTTYDWKTPVDTSTPGTKPGTVVVTYPDGTKDEVPVPVTVGEQADLYTPVGQDVPAKHGETPAASQGIANRGTLPAGTTYDWKTPVDTSTPGDKPATVVVTYPDGTKDEVPVTVKVKPQSDEFTPAGQDVPTKHGETPNAADGIANKGDLPADTKYDWKTPVDTSTPGDKPGTVVVTYPDGTKDEVPVTVKVKPQSDEFTPNGQDVPAKHGETPKAEDGIANKGDLPDGTKFDWKTPVDTTTPGDKSGTVVVTYPDGTKDEVPVTVKVKPQSDEFTPVGKDVPAKHGETPKAEDGIANKGDLPDGTKYDWKTPVDTTTPGDKPGTVVVTYPDGTKDEISVTVKVKPQSDEFTPQPKDVSTDHGKTPKAEDGIANKGDLPDGTKYDWKTPVDTTTPGDKPGTVVVTYPDGTKDEVPVTVHVGSQSDLYNPDGQNLNVKQGDQPEASKGIANRGNLPDGTTYDWKTPVDTSTVGDKPATVVVTYPDGSKDEVSVTVKVTEKLHVKTPADKVPVKDPSNLTPDDINKVVENIKKENPGLPDDAKITVNPNGGDTTIETKDGDKVTIPGSDLVRPETDADKNNVKVPADKVPVKDPSNLTDAEKDKVKDNIKNANPDLPNGTKIDVAKDGTATITFPDGSTKVIPGTDLVRPEADADKNNV
ncbi:Rib/alpha-like domain-containing protein, partial [Streptococcus parasanguinis]|uniref:Rib/alpha-like domain-containing protein n=1 Tax=Streptococcus parasanguinis TaxID=1318 RepID=UPI00352CD374